MEKNFTNTQLVSALEGFIIKKIKTEAIRIADAYPDIESLNVSYLLLEKYDVRLSSVLLDTPTRFFKCFKTALFSVLPPDRNPPLNIRITDIPSKRANNILVRNLKNNMVGKFITVDGLVRRVSETQPLLILGAFQCERCGTITMIKQDGPYTNEPMECDKDSGGCGSGGNRTRFKLITEILDEGSQTSQFEDVQIIEIQEPPEGLRGGQDPKRLQALLRKDLINTVMPGNRITLTGTLHSRKRGGQSSKSNYYMFYLETNSVQIIDTDYEEIDISPKDEEYILQLSKDPHLRERMLDSLAPAIHGMSPEKEAILLLLFGGTPIIVDGQTRVRGDIHMLMVGDPGIAKSQLLAYVSKLAPRGIYASGKSSSAAGLTAAAVRESAELTGDSRWVLEAGALVLADKGVACIDEIDKMRDTDRDSIHTAMEQQYIAINKAGISATMQSRCAVLAAANPTLGRFDPHRPQMEQIDMDPALISRFDIIFMIHDLVNEDLDRKIAEHIMDSRFLGEVALSDTDEFKKEAEAILQKRGHPIPQELLRKYIAYARKNISPVMGDDGRKKLVEYYVAMRRRAEGGPAAMTPRNIDAMGRLTEASARMHLRQIPTEEDFKTSIRIVMAFLESSSTNEEGIIDADIITTGFGASQRDRIWTILEIIKDIQGTDGASVDDIVRIATERGVPTERVRGDLDRLKREGRIYAKFEDRYRLA